MKSFKIWAFALVSSLALSAPSALAADGSSGCGAGWYVFKNNSLISSSLRSTTNSIMSNNTWGMTFGTSNCAKHSIVRNEMAPVYFAESNQETLALEMAQGDGQYVEAFAQTLGCNSAVMPEFKNMTRAHYGQIFKSQNTQSHEMLKEVKQQIRANAVLSFGCSA